MRDPWAILAALRQHRTAARAAQALGIDLATLYRQLGRMEAEVGGRLFTRQRQGWQITAAGRRLQAAAVDLGQAMIEARALVRAERDSAGGLLRVAVSESLAEGLLAPAMADFHLQFPQLQLDLMISNDLSNLAAMEADCAIRAESGPPLTLSGQLVGRIEHAAYATEALWPHTAPARSPAALRQLPWLAYRRSTEAFTAARWMRRHGLDDRAVAGFDQLGPMATAAGQGLGVAVLPVHLARRTDGLRLVLRPPRALSVDVWLLCQQSLRRTSRMNAFFGFFSALFREQQPRFLLTALTARSRRPSNP
ncbi:MAG: LysR family transcriptional regulator [Burkholderiaceae bacterium]